MYVRGVDGYGIVGELSGGWEVIGESDSDVNWYVCGVSEPVVAHVIDLSVALVAVCGLVCDDVDLCGLGVG